MRGSNGTYCRKWPYIVVSIALLATGSMVYLLFRHDIILFDLLGHPKSIESIGLHSPDVGNFWGYFFMYCFPDIVWYVALLIFSSIFFVRGNSVSTLLLVISITMPFVLEVMQAVGIFPGTFDWYDIVFYSITLIIFILYMTVANYKTLKK